MSNNKNFPDASLSFDIPCKESALDFFKRMQKQHHDAEDAVRKRIEQLFSEVVTSPIPEYARKTLVGLFGIGYQLGWNDRNSAIVIDEDLCWTIYNFVNEWKFGEFGEVSLREALSVHPLDL